jgi:uncharacterized membrane protein YqjE
VVSPLAAVRRLSASSLNLLLTRAQGASVELALVRAQLLRWAGLALTVAGLWLLASMAASALLVIVLWNWAGPVTLVVLAVGYAVAAFAMGRRLRREIESAPPLLADTLAEIAKDRDAILGGHGSEADRSAGAAP